MPVRYPPERIPPTAMRPKKDPRPKSRIVAYAEPELSFWRRVARRLMSPPALIAIAVVATVIIVPMVYYWTVFSGRIDNLLKGEVFTRSAGIYAAPKQLRIGQALTQERLIAFLQHAGYVEKSQQADKARGRYYLSGGIVDVEPSDHTRVDGLQQFQRVRVQFSRNGKTIS